MVIGHMLIQSHSWATMLFYPIKVEQLEDLSLEFMMLAALITI